MQQGANPSYVAAMSSSAARATASVGYPLPPGMSVSSRNVSPSRSCETVNSRATVIPPLSLSPHFAPGASSMQARVLSPKVSLGSFSATSAAFTKSESAVRDELASRRIELEALSTLVDDSTLRISQLTQRLAERQAEAETLARPPNCIHTLGLRSSSDKCLLPPEGSGEASMIQARAHAGRRKEGELDGNHGVTSQPRRWSLAADNVEDVVDRAIQHATSDGPGRCLPRQLQLQLLGTTLKQCLLQVDQVLLRETLNLSRHNLSGSADVDV